MKMYILKPAPLITHHQSGIWYIISRTDVQSTVKLKAYETETNASKRKMALLMSALTSFFHIDLLVWCCVYLFASQKLLVTLGESRSSLCLCH